MFRAEVVTLPLKDPSVGERRTETVDSMETLCVEVVELLTRRVGEVRSRVTLASVKAVNVQCEAVDFDGERVLVGVIDGPWLDGLSVELEDIVALRARLLDRVAMVNAVAPERESDALRVPDCSAVEEVCSEGVDDGLQVWDVVSVADAL